MSCPICNQPDYIQCNCSSEPFCDPCTSDSKCIQKVDAECVIYHRDDDKPSKLTCMGIPNKTPLETILETIDGFICSINVVQTPLTVIDSPSVDLTAWGVLKHTLQADVKISSASGNTLTILGDGLYDTETPLTVIDSNSVNLTASGTYDHTLQADVNISSASGNTLVVLNDGLFTSGASGNTVTANSGLTKTGNNIQLGGTLLNPTNIFTSNTDQLSIRPNITTNYAIFGNTTSFVYCDTIDPSTVDPAGTYTVAEFTSKYCATTVANVPDFGAVEKYSLGSFRVTPLIGSLEFGVPINTNALIPPTLPETSATTYFRAESGKGTIKATDLFLPDILNTKNDTGTNVQANVLYTNGAGKVCSAPLLTASAVLDFPSTSTNTSSDLTITVAGAADGDVVALGVPNASVNVNSSFSAWVSAPNTVTVRFNNYSSGSIDPASGTFKVKVFKG